MKRNQRFNRCFYPILFYISIVHPETASFGLKPFSLCYHPAPADTAFLVCLLVRDGN
jgi:hypothetical protein